MVSERPLQHLAKKGEPSEEVTEVVAENERAGLTWLEEKRVRDSLMIYLRRDVDVVDGI